LRGADHANGAILVEDHDMVVRACFLAAEQGDKAATGQSSWNRCAKPYIIQQGRQDVVMAE
jgi:hypothetical protein